MPDPSGGERTLPASARKRERQREEGNIAKSQDLGAGFMLLAGLGSLYFLGATVFATMLAATTRYLGAFSTTLVDIEAIAHLNFEAIAYVGRATLPLMLALLVSGIAIHLVQVGPLMAPKALKPRFGRLNPISGFQRFASLRTFTELVKSLCKLGLATYLVWLVMRSRWEELQYLMMMTPMGAAGYCAELVGTIWLRVAMAMLAIGLLDMLYQRWQWDRDQMMTVQEAREEARELEGDPRIRQRVRQLQRQMATQRMLAEVPQADVIVTNPTRYAVALRYDQHKMGAPVVVAKGARLVAERIRELAIEHDVPIVERPPLARTLYRTVEVGHPIPETLFRAVAEVLAFVYQVDRRASKAAERSDTLRMIQQPA